MNYILCNTTFNRFDVISRHRTEAAALKANERVQLAVRGFGYIPTQICFKPEWMKAPAVGATVAVEESGWLY